MAIMNNVNLNNFLNILSGINLSILFPKCVPKNTANTSGIIMLDSSI